MKFGLVPLEQAEGKILAHHIVHPDGSRLLSKGKPLKVSDLADLRSIGRDRVYVAEPEPFDVDEDEAACRIAQALGGEALVASRPAAGRVNLQAASLGILRVDVPRLELVNEIDGVAIATRLANSVIQPRHTAVTVKIIPFAIPEESVQQAERYGRRDRPVLDLQPLRPHRVALVLTGSPWTQARVIQAFESPIRQRIEHLGSQLGSVEFVSIESDDFGEQALMQAIQGQVRAGAELVILAGEMGIMDLQDAGPRAIERLGGQVTCFGAPVDPGNLMMTARLGAVPVLGAPGCARSLKPNVIDWVLPRMLAGDQLTRADIISLGHGGLLTGANDGNREDFSSLRV